MLPTLKNCLGKSEIPPHNAKESWYQASLHSIVGGRMEVPCKGIGRIDILTDEYIIEVKQAKGWKHALGQAYCYSAYYHNRSMVLALIGQPDPIVNEVCRNLGIIVVNFWNNRWQLQY